MQLAPALTFASHSRPFHLEKTGTQWLSVTGYVPVRFLATYRCEASRLRTLVPAPFTLDTIVGFRFVIACPLQDRELQLHMLPNALPLLHHHFLYQHPHLLHDYST